MLLSVVLKLTAAAILAEQTVKSRHLRSAWLRCDTPELDFHHSAHCGFHDEVAILRAHGHLRAGRIAGVAVRRFTSVVVLRLV
jgi:hypothetical protein